MAFEQFMDGFFKGDFGQYFTPREIIAFAVEMLSPTHTDLVLDPACGSGGFLLYALDAVRREADEYYDEGTPEHKIHWHDFAQKRLFGIELNDSIARVAKMNMIVHDDGHTNVISVDSLQEIEKTREENRGFAFNRFDIILTNPPFGAVVKKTENRYLDQYDLDYDWKDGARSGKPKASMKTEILFLERCWQFLKPNGRMAIVLPDGILTNSSLQSVRDWLLEHYRLTAVISLPQYSFAHYGAGVKASLVFLQKRETGKTPSDDEAIFMAIAENIGYDATGRKTFKPFKQAQIAGDIKTEWVRCDLFDMEFTYERDALTPDNWNETHRKIIPNTGLVAQWQEFDRDPEPLFA